MELTVVHDPGREGRANPPALDIATARSPVAGRPLVRPQGPAATSADVRHCRSPADAAAGAGPPGCAHDRHPARPIAGTLVVSPATARTHVSRATTKLGARDRAQLVVFAYQSGLA